MVPFTLLWYPSHYYGTLHIIVVPFTFNHSCHLLVRHHMDNNSTKSFLFYIFYYFFLIVTWSTVEA